jgi:hypothetical protein
MPNNQRTEKRGHVFGLADWLDWLGHMANRLFGLTAAEFEAAYRKGEMRSASANDLGSVLPIIDRLRAQNALN